MSRWLRPLALLALLLIPAAARSQDIANDPAVLVGTLANGFQYFFVPNRVDPSGRLHVELIVRAGSIDEADDQRGGAHLLEHMAFNGSTHFKPGELFEYFRSLGSRIGPHINGATTYDYTSYTLQVPAEQDGAAGRAFEALRDIAGGLTLDASELERERGVIIEEWRGRLGATERMRQPELAAVLGDSIFMRRQPIGSPDTIRTMSQSRLADFYHQHYRADRMAVLIAGPLGRASVEALIRTYFSDLPAQPAQPRPLPALPAPGATRFAVVSDPEASASAVTITYVRPQLPVRTLADFRRTLLERVTRQLMSARFAAISRGPNAPFLAVQLGEGAVAPGAAGTSFTALVGPKPILPGLTSLVQELARARQHGFSDEEMARAKLEVQTSVERTRGDNAGIAAILRRHYLSDEPVRGPLAEVRMSRALLPAITAADVTSMLGDLWPDTNRAVVVRGPTSASSMTVTSGALDQAVQMAASAPVSPWIAPAAATPRTAVSAPIAGSIRARREIEEIGVTVLTLSNGVDVWLKPTSFNRGEVVFRAYAKGGASLAPAAEFVEATLGGVFVAGAGVGGLAPDERAQALAGRQMRVTPFVGSSVHGLTGVARAPDLEQALEMVHLYFTAPNGDAASLQRAKNLMLAGIQNQSNNPVFALRQRISEINGMGHPAIRIPGAEDIAGARTLGAFEYFRDRFANAGRFTFFFAGSFTVESIAPLLVRYIASLPSEGAGAVASAEPPVATRVEPTFPAGIVRETVRRGIEPQSQTAITFFADTGLDPLKTEQARGAAAVLHAALFNRLREMLGATYSVTVSYSDTSPTPGWGTISILFGSAPENAERLTAMTLEEIARLRTAGPSAADVQAVTAARLRDLRAQQLRNDAWVDALLTVHALGRDPLSVGRQVEMAESALSVPGIHEAFRRYFPADRYTVVTLVPDMSR